MLEKYVIIFFLFSALYTRLQPSTNSVQCQLEMLMDPKRDSAFAYVEIQNLHIISEKSACVQSAQVIDLVTLQ